ncbi:MAG: uracil-DNA glycosylase, partial [Planctomycetes bacterium]|nr:uracil-DNA glycosylase [Planctomycetota bacterium]
AEINSCNAYLSSEIQALPDAAVVLALGSIAHNSVIKALSLRQKEFKFGHNALHQIADGIQLLDSYHCSRYNTQTRRLTPEMFCEMFAHARELLG